MNTLAVIMASAVSTTADGIYLGWGPFTVQLGNLIVILVMIVLFVAALFLPFPGGKDRP